MKNPRFVVSVITFVLVAACVGLALYFRIALPYDKIFTNEWIKFSGTDSYFFIRVVDNIIHNYPRVINFDPYLLYPSGFSIFTPPFFPFFVASTILAVTLGSPSQAMIDTVGVYIPAILGALTVIPVFFIGKYIFNRWAGIIAACLIAILPGEFLGRSILGFTDQHVAETLISTIAVLFFILALKTASASPDIKLAWNDNRKAFYKLLIYGVLAGVFLGLYLITWYGALLFVMVIFIYIIVQQILNHISNTPMSSLSFAGSITFLIALIIFLMTSTAPLVLIPLIIGVLIPVILNVFSIGANRYNLKPVLFPVSILGIGAIAAVCFYFVSPSTFNQIVASLNIFTWPRNTTILEMQPIFFPGNQLSLSAVWGNFTISFFLTLAALGVLIYLAIKRREPDITFIVVWSLIILAATLSMRRFAYYFVVNAAVLTGYISWWILDWLTFKKDRFTLSLIWGAFTLLMAVLGFAMGFLAFYPDFVFSLLIAIIAGVLIYFLADRPRQPEVKAVAKSKKHGKKNMLKGSATGGVTGRSINPVIAISVVFSICIAVIFPNRAIAEATAKGVFFAPTNAWCESLTWLKNNTPDPFNKPDYYYEYYKTPAPGEKYQYPGSAYSIASWWDYGYWITRIGHRIPVSNPGTNHNGEAYYFMATDENKAVDMMNKWNSKYVIINVDMPMANRKFYALASLSGNDIFNFVDAFYTEKNGQLEPQVLYYPSYFQTMVVRLYNFDGKAVAPKESIVVTYVEKKTSRGEPYKMITGSKSFTSYESAQNYLAGLKTSDSAGIFSNSPFSSPIPLEHLKNYKLVHSSVNQVSIEQGTSISEVKTFEYSR